MFQLIYKLSPGKFSELIRIVKKVDEFKTQDTHEGLTLKLKSDFADHLEKYVPLIGSKKKRKRIFALKKSKAIISSVGNLDNLSTRERKKIKTELLNKKLSGVMNPFVK